MKTEKTNTCDASGVIHLVALISNNALVGEELPCELKLFDIGVNQTVKGPVSVGAKTRASLARLQRERGYDKVALDFEHNTVPGTKAYKESSEPRTVAAFGTPELRADGLYLANLIWTPEGKKSARNFIDLSPAPQLDENGEVMFLHSVALCRQGAVDGLSFFTVDMPMTGENEINKSEDELMEKILAALRKGLGLAETATEADIETALTALTAGMAHGAKSMEAITTLKADLTTLTAPALSKVEGQLTELKTKVETFTAELERRDRADIMSQAAREGKVVPLTAEQVATTAVPTLRDIVEKLVVSVPVEKRTPANVQTFSADGGSELTAMQKEIAKNCGVDPAKLVKSNK